MGHGRCDAGGLTFETCPRGCLIKPFGTDDVCFGTTHTWSCTGAAGTSKLEDGDYYANAFGYWTDASSVLHSDPTGNCIPACLPQAQAGGLCAADTEAMSAVGLCIVLGLFGMKLLWNVSVPYVLAARACAAGEPQRMGISLMPTIDLVLLSIGVALAAIRAAEWPWSAEGVAVIGMATIVGSYLHLIVIGGALGWLAQKWRRKDGQ